MMGGLRHGCQERGVRGWEGGLFGLSVSVCGGGGFSGNKMASSGEWRAEGEQDGGHLWDGRRL